MASNLIGNWAVKLSADASALVQGLDDASRKTVAFAQKASTVTKTIATGANRALASIAHIDLGQQTAELGKMASAIANVGVGAATGGIVGGAMAAMAAAGAMAEFGWKSMEAVASQVKLGRQIGLTTQQVAGLQAIAARRGVTDQLGSGLTQFTEKLAHLRREVDSGQGGVQTSALARMGINAHEFVRLDLPEQFARIAEGAQSISAPMERNAALIEMLGHRGMTLAPLFKESGDDLRNMGAAAGEAGMAMSQEQAEMLAKTVEDTKRLGASIVGIFKAVGGTVALALAPHVRAVSDAFKVVMPYIKPILYFIGFALAGALMVFLAPLIAISWVIKGLVSLLGGDIAGGATTSVQSLGAATQNVATNAGMTVESMERNAAAARASMEAANAQQALAIQLRERWVELGSSVARGPGSQWQVFVNAQQLANSMASAALTAQQIAAESQAQVARSLAQGGGAAYAVQNGGGTSALLDELVISRKIFGQTQRNAQIQKAIRDQNLTLAQQEALWAEDRFQTEREVAGSIREQSQAALMEYATMRMTATERQMLLAANQGATAEQQRQLGFMLQQRDIERERLDTLRQMGEAANHIREQSRSPVDVFQQRIQAAQELLDAGQIGQRNFGNEAAAAFRALEQQTSRPDRGPAQAVLAGSAAEQQAIAAAQRQDQQSQRDPMERLRAIMESQRRIQIEQRDAMREFVTLARDGFIGQLGD